ncbi:hypothetical protein B0T18DRAFT_401658 [Schizothecium vesticola]|uniref:Uncharacterized protein n=1 Tax=Schizothecium vesticola TaxID=314040 RepID=A0AA40F4Y9_9PEZI|nr:hypothetical protein B0T18DRAFT_401658 [Schizothecium vesticola]
MRAFIRPPAGRDALEMGHWMDKWWWVDTLGCVVVVSLVFPNFPLGGRGTACVPFPPPFLSPSFFFIWTARRRLGIWYCIACMAGCLHWVHGLFFFFPFGIAAPRMDDTVGMDCILGILGSGIGQQNDEALRAGLVWRLG